MIGIFDSGVGGLNVARTIEHLCPEYPFLYFGDTGHAPYGSKSAATLIDYCCSNTDFLLERGAKVIVIACNSAASAASEVLKGRYPIPVIDVITSASRKAATMTRNNRIGVIGTRTTVQSGMYEDRIQAVNPDSTVFSRACPLLVPLIEEGWRNKRETRMILRRYLHPLRLKQIDTLVLGCTLYPLLSSLIGPRIGKRVQLIDSSLEAASELKQFLDDNPDFKDTLHYPAPSRFFVSDLTEPVRELACSIFGRTITLEHVNA